MRISHKSKKFTPLHPQIASLIAELLTKSTAELPQYLATIDSWKWPRSDLNAWIKVLNKFDDVLEEIIREYDVDKLQTREFTPHAKATLCEVLKFERFLLENSTNRKMFNSYDRLNSLLLTSELDVLIAALFLLLRPSQQYSSQPAVSHSLHISTARLEALAKPWPPLRDLGVDMVHLVSDKAQDKIETLPQDVSEVDFTFYRKAGDKLQHDSHEATHSKSQSEQSSGAVNVHLGPLSQTTRSVTDVLTDAVISYQVPDSEKYELMCRIRFARSLGPGRYEDRQRLTTVRLLAIAIYSHTHSEAQAQQSIFLYETDLLARIADLLQLDRDVPVIVQTAAIAALDAIARYRNKIQEVLTAINAGVNHGIALSLFRKTVADVSNSDSTLPHVFVDALLSFVIYLASHSSGGNMVVSAGLVPLLIQIIGITLPQRLPIVSKAMQLVDNVLYGFTNAFQMFCNGHGIEALTNRIKYEVDLAIDTHGVDANAHAPASAYGLLHVSRASVLKHILRSMHRMMQSSGTTEGMRGLIDSSLLKSVQRIIDYRGVFGPTILPIAINIVATFVHNEPTSLATIQEAKVPETIYNALEAGLEPSIEVIQAIPNAIGALCLNQAGQEQLAARPSVIPALFSIFTSERHLKVLQDKESAALIGSSIDELIRHHPSLKNLVFDAIVSIISKLESLGNDYNPPSDIEHWYRLLPRPRDLSVDDVAMEDVSSASNVVETVGDALAQQSELSNIVDDVAQKPHDNIVISFVDILGRFMEGLFQHGPHCRDFLTEKTGLDHIARLSALQCLPYDFASSANSDSLVQVIRTMTEVAAAETYSHLVKQIRQSLQETEVFWRSTGSNSQLLAFVDLTDEQTLHEANIMFRRLITLYNRMTLLSDVCAAVGYTHGQSSIALLQSLSEPDILSVIADLGALHRSCLWENILLKSGIDSKNATGSSSRSMSPSGVARPSSTANVPNGDSSAVHQVGTESREHALEDASSIGTPRERNSRAVRHLASQMPNALSPFFQALGRMLTYIHSRRGHDPSYKKQAQALSKTLADVMHKHLSEKRGAALPMHAYYTMMLGLITVFLFEDRSSQTSVQIMLLVQFFRVGGVDAVLEICRHFTSAVIRISDLRATDRTETDKQELVHVYGGLKVALHLVYSLVSWKPSADFAHLVEASSNDKSDTHPGYFEPHDFLVRMRLAIAPFVIELWQSTWLINAPPGVSKHVIQSVLEIVTGENEEAKPVVEPGIFPASSTGLLRPSAPNEDHVRQLTDMGFPRTAAVRALTRCRDNITLATEYLLSQPIIAEEEQEAAPAEAESAEGVSGDTPSSSGPETGEADIDATSSVEPTSAADDQSEVVSPGKTNAERKEELQRLREMLKTNIGSLALRLVDAHPSLIFDVRQVFTGQPENQQVEAVRSVLDDIDKFAPSAFDVNEEPLAIRCRLLALILTESSRTVLQVIGDGAQALMDKLLALLLSRPFQDEKEQALPKWLAAHLLVVEALLVLSEEPRSIALPLADEPVGPEVLFCGPPYTEVKSVLFDFCLRLLRIPTLPRDELLAALRVLIQLTRREDFAQQFVARDGLALLLQRFKGQTDGAAISACQSYTAIILRHTVENHMTLERLMRSEVIRSFSQSRTRDTDAIANFMRNTGSIASRDPQLFIDVVKSLCTLTSGDPTARITLKPTNSTDGTQQTSEVDPVTSGDKDHDMQLDTQITAAVVDAPQSVEAVVHFMIGELLRVGKSALEGIKPAEAAVIQTGSVAQSSQTGSQAAGRLDTLRDLAAPDHRTETSESSKDQADFLYACFLMQCLTELLFSYDHCKAAFLSYTKKRAHSSAKDGITRSKPVALNFLLADLVSIGAFNAEPKGDEKKRIMLCNWAMSVIVALCVDSAPSAQGAADRVDLTSVRKVVLDTISRAIKEPLPGEITDARYGRLHALADLCHRLLTVRFNAGLSKTPEETPLHLAKVMLEKNFVATLTGLLSDIDLNYPNIRSLVTAILRPLEHLTKVAIKMGRASEKSKGSQDRQSVAASSLSSDDEENSDEDEDEDIDSGVGREETPDLYRNSSLGMYGGEMDDTAFGSDDAMDEDEDDDEDDAEMDYDDEADSDDTSNTDEEVNDVDELAIATGDNADEWHDEDMDEDDGDNEEDEDEGLEDDEADEDAEIMWQDIGDTDGAHEDALADDDDEADLEDLPIVNEHNGDEEQEADSVEGDLADELGELEEAEEGHHDVEEDPGYGHQVIRIRDRGFYFTTGVHVPPRDLDSELHPFGRPRHVGASAEATTHPLLVDANGASASSSTPHRGYQRRPQRSAGIGHPHSDVFQAIDDVFGEGAMELFQQVVSRTVAGGAVGADIRVEIPSMTFMTGTDRGHLHRHTRRGATSITIRDPGISRSRPDGSEFGPLPTNQRLAEEAKITHGKHLQDRLNKLCNHIILALLPDAREAARLAREKAEKEREEAEQKAAQSLPSTDVAQASSNIVLSESTESTSLGETVMPSQASVEHEQPDAAVTDDQDAEMLDVAEASHIPISEQARTDAESRIEVDVPAGDVANDAAQEAPAAEAGSTAEAEGVSAEASSTATQTRVTVLIHGNPVDITDTGIDPTFLEALPDDMREEVLNQHFREQRTSRVEQQTESQLNREFLEALPPDIRAELLQQERLERSGRDQHATGDNSGQTGPVDMDPASFIASLDPQLRQVVLLDQDEGFLQTLPSHMIAEAGAYREGSHQIHHIRREQVAQPTSAPTPRKSAQPRDAIQLLDRAGVASLVRLLFFPRLRRNSLHKILLNLCENSKSRTDLFNLLLSILHDGTGDVSVVDKSFAQLSFRPTKQSSQSPSKLARQRTAPEYPTHPTAISSYFPGDVPPDLVTQRCLDALTSIMVSNELSSLFFLTEHELPAGLKRATSKKGKGKEKQVSQTHYPVVLLLQLLDREVLLKTPSIMDSVAGLLDAVTRPLTSLAVKKDAEVSSQQEPSSAQSTASQAQPTTETEPASSTAPATGARSVLPVIDVQANIENSASASTIQQGASAQPEVPKPSESLEEKILLSNPPQIPHSALRLVVNILTVGDCSGRTFQHTLALIQHLAYLPDARDVIAQELKSRAQEFGQNLYADLDALIGALQNSSGQDELPSALSAKFSPASSEQAKLLRILKTIDYMFSHKVSPTAGAPGTEAADEEGLYKIYETFRFTPLWQRLGDCLSVVGKNADVEHIATILLPLIESLMVVCKHVGVKSTSAPTRFTRTPSSPRTPLTPSESMEDLFVTFTDNHRKVLNLMVRNNPSLMSGSFSLLVQNSRVLDFDNKRNYFSQQLRRRPATREHYGTLQLNVRRARVFEDSYHTFQHKTGDQIKYGKLSVRFYGEEGVDAGGVTREWFQILARQMFDPNYALFEPCAADKQTYQPNRASAINPDHLQYFKFVGRVIGKAIYDGRLMDAHFARSLYRQLLGKQVDYRDVEWVDPEYYKSLCWILENDPTVLDLAFITEVDEFGKREVIPLKENGASTLVTVENRKEYVQLSAQYRLYSSIKDQIENLLAGFYEIVPKDLIAIFNEQEVELLISGTPDIDVDEWRAATEYSGYTSSDPVIVWWWRALKSFNRDERAKVLSFATGTSRVPLGGFVDLQGVQGVQRFSIHRAYGHPDRLPQAHTCFNQIDLPQYTSYEMLRQQLLLAINEGGEGFGFA